MKFSAPLIEGKENDTNPVNQLPLGELDTVADRVIRRLKDRETSPIRIRDTVAKSEVSPWLERTRWTNYFEGHILAEASDLGRPIEIEREPLLQALVCSVDRLVEAAYVTVCELLRSAMYQLVSPSEEDVQPTTAGQALVGYL